MARKLSEEQLERLKEKNRKYWGDREDEALKHYIKDEKEYDRQIEKIYRDMLDSVQKEIDGFYGRYAKKEGISINEAKKRVTEADVKAYERKAKRYVRDKDFSKQANEEMRLYNLTMKVNRLEMLKANIGLDLIKGHDELEKYMAEILQGRTTEELERQAGILGNTITINSKMAHAIPNSSFHNARFSDRIWAHQDLLKADLSKLLQTGLIQGKNPRVLARELESKFNTSRYNAECLMRTELARVQTEVQKASLERNGFTQFEFLANLKCCDICQKKHKKIFKLDGFKYGDNAPPLHPHCRCAIAPFEDTTEFDAWLDHVGSGGGTTWADWQKIAKTAPPSSKPATKIDRVADTKDFDALCKYLSEEYNISVDDAVKTLDFETVRSAISGVESVIAKVPSLKNSVKSVEIYRNAGTGAVMGCDGKSVKFNPKYFKTKKLLQQSCELSSKKGWWVKNSTVESIGAHECGHAVEWLMIQKSPEYVKSWRSARENNLMCVEAWRKNRESKKIVSQACKNVKKTPYGKGKLNADLISSISRYANTNASETMAEAFADVCANGANANPLSIEIERLAIETLKSYEGGSKP